MLNDNEPEYTGARELIIGHGRVFMCVVTKPRFYHVGCKANKRMSLKTILKVSTNLGMIILGEEYSYVW